MPQDRNFEIRYPSGHRVEGGRFVVVGTKSRGTDVRAVWLTGSGDDIPHADIEEPHGDGPIVFWYAKFVNVPTGTYEVRAEARRGGRLLHPAFGRPFRCLGGDDGATKAPTVRRSSSSPVTVDVPQDQDYIGGEYDCFLPRGSYTGENVPEVVYLTSVPPGISFEITVYPDTDDKLWCAPFAESIPLERAYKFKVKYAGNQYTDEIDVTT